MSDTSGRTPEGAKGWFDHQLDIAESAFQKLPQYMQDAARNRNREVDVDVEQAGTPSVENGMICGECGSAKSPKHCCHVCDGRAQDAMGRVLPSVADWFGPQPMPEGWPAAIDPKDARIAEQEKERDEARQQRDDAESRERSWISECLMYRRAQETNQAAFDKVLAERDTLRETTGQQAAEIERLKTELSKEKRKCDNIAANMQEDLRRLDECDHERQVLLNGFEDQAAEIERLRAELARKGGEEAGSQVGENHPHEALRRTLPDGFAEAMRKENEEAQRRRVTAKEEAGPFGMRVTVDPRMPGGTVEMRSGEQSVVAVNVSTEESTK